MSEYWYLSGDGSPKGPFTIKKMREWHQFYPLQMNLDVMVRLGNEGSFKPLREWPQLVAPEGSPEAEDAPAAAVQTALVPRKPLQWYYAVDGAEYGPYSVEQLRLWESSGSVATRSACFCFCARARLALCRRCRSGCGCCGCGCARVCKIPTAPPTHCATATLSRSCAQILCRLCRGAGAE